MMTKWKGKWKWKKAFVDKHPRFSLEDYYKEFCTFLRLFESIFVS